jgi:hypothetical protein
MASSRHRGIEGQNLWGHPFSGFAKMGRVNPGMGGRVATSLRDFAIERLRLPAKKPLLRGAKFLVCKDWLRGRDLNPRPLGYEPNELPDCSTPRQVVGRRLSTGGVLDARRFRRRRARFAAEVYTKVEGPPAPGASALNVASRPTRWRPHLFRRPGGRSDRRSTVGGPLHRSRCSLFDLLRLGRHHAVETAGYEVEDVGGQA